MSEEQAPALKACPFCGSADHLSVSPCGSLTADMTARPHRIVCNHLDCDYVQGPVGYGQRAAIKAWNTRTPDPAVAGLVEAAPIWRNGITNTAMLIDLVRKRHASSLRRNKAFAAFDVDMNELLEQWFRLSRTTSPQTYEEAEAVYRQALATWSAQ